MIDHLLQLLICERLLTDARYRERHLRVANIYPMGMQPPSRLLFKVVYDMRHKV